MSNNIRLIIVAKQRKAEWTLASLMRYLDAICAQTGLRIDWQKGDEGWARILREDNLYGIVGAELPVAFIHVSIEAVANKFILNGLPLIYPTSDFDAPFFSTSHKEIQALFGRALSANVDYERLSINDLWWTTVH